MNWDFHLGFHHDFHLDLRLGFHLGFHLDLHPLRYGPSARPTHLSGYTPVWLHLWFGDSLHLRCPECLHPALTWFGHLPARSLPRTWPPRPSRGLLSLRCLVLSTPASPLAFAVGIRHGVRCHPQLVVSSTFTDSVALSDCRPPPDELVETNVWLGYLHRCLVLLTASLCSPACW